MTFLTPDWPAPNNVRAISTTRQAGEKGGDKKSGASQPPFNSFNLGGHVGDEPIAVASNRQYLREALSLPGEPNWLNQTHGIVVADLDKTTDALPEADASTTTITNTICTVLTADCLPVLFCNKAGTRVAAAHAGWRGLASGVLEATVSHFNEAPENIIAWLGPAIGPRAFEVGEDVRQAFCDTDPAAAEAFISVLNRNKAKTDTKKWMADAYKLARQRLATVGVKAVYGGGHCTFTEADKFYSYRRDGKTGRMASLVWVEAST